jgi:hypothetical protein
MPSKRPLETMPVEALLADSAPPLRELAEDLRSIVLAATPDAIERVRPGWRLIGYDLPIRRHGAFFAWVWPELEHVHIGFPRGIQMDDPKRAMKGAGVTKAARWLTFKAGDRIDGGLVGDLVLEAARVAAIPRGL